MSEVRLQDVLGFDAAFFSISPREAVHIDPQQRLLLELAWEAIEDAAIPITSIANDRTGLFLGITGQDYRHWCEPSADMYSATGNGNCFAVGRISYALGLRGPSIAIDTACSSSLVAVHQGRLALMSGESDVVLAGGVNLVLSPRSTAEIRHTNSLADDGLCKTFDARANGFARGEGGGVFVLKRLPDAIRDQDKIHAIISGSAVNHDGRSTGFTAPNVLSQVELIKSALSDADLAAKDLSALEAHGTGTRLGDPIEIEALRIALDGDRELPLPIGAVKATLGHLEAAAGVAGLARALLSTQYHEAYPVAGLETLNPMLDLGECLSIPRSATPLGSSSSHIGVSSFGMSGTNAHIIVSSFDEVENIHPSDSFEQYSVPGFELSASTKLALRDLARSYADWLDESDPSDYPGFCWTATYGRSRLKERAVVLANDSKSAISALRQIAEGETSLNVRLRTTTLSEPADAMLLGLPKCIADIPRYSWQRKTYAPPALTGDATDESTEHSASSDLGIQEDIDHCIFRISWETIPFERSSQPLVIVSNGSELPSKVCQAAKTAGRVSEVYSFGSEWEVEQGGEVMLIPDKESPRECVGQMLELIAKLPPRTKLKIAITSNSGELDFGPTDPSGGALWGILPVIRIERPHSQVSVVTIPEDATDLDINLLATFEAPSSEDLLCVQDGLLYGGRFQKDQLSGDRWVVDPDHLYVVTGGLGAVGKVFVEELLESGAKHIAILGRTGKELLGVEDIQFLTDIKSRATFVEYVSVDVRDENALRKVIEGLGNELNRPIKGVIHCAGIISRTSISDFDLSLLDAQLDVKDTGLANLVSVIDPFKLDFIAVTSSVSAVFGVAGFGAYAAANGAVDARVRSLKAQGVNIGSVAFGPWELAGMASSDDLVSFSAGGVMPVPPEWGTAALAESVSKQTPIIAAAFLFLSS